MPYFAGRNFIDLVDPDDYAHYRKYVDGFNPSNIIEVDEERANQIFRRQNEEWVELELLASGEFMIINDKYKVKTHGKHKWKQNLSQVGVSNVITQKNLQK